MSFTALNATIKISSGAKILAILEIEKSMETNYKTKLRIVEVETASNTPDRPKKEGQEQKLIRLYTTKFKTMTAQNILIVKKFLVNYFKIVVLLAF